MTPTKRSCRKRVSRGCRLKTRTARQKPANSQDAASHQTILKTLVTKNAKTGPSLGVGSDGKTPAASSIKVKPPKEASWQRKRATGFSRKASRVTRKPVTRKTPARANAIGGGEIEPTPSAIMRGQSRRHASRICAAEGPKRRRRSRVASDQQPICREKSLRRPRSSR